MRSVRCVALLKWVIDGHRRWLKVCPLYPQKRTLGLNRVMSALCQKQTFRPLLDIIVGGQGCSSSWSITRETSPQTISASGSGHRRAPGRLADRKGANLSDA